VRLESVREVKAQVRDSVIRRELNTVRRVGAYGLPASHAEDLAKVLPTVALGIVPRPHSDYRLAVRVQRHGLLSSDIVAQIGGLAGGEIDVRLIGDVTKRDASQYRRRRRPLVIGCSVGHYAVTAGTIGCFVRDRRDAVAMLSNNHVLADENRGSKGDDCLQPGSLDGGRTARDVVGTLDTFVKINWTARNTVDAALATVADDIGYDATTLAEGVRLTKAVADGSEVEAVAKVGRTTGLTRGQVTAFEVDNVVVGYDQGDAAFDGQLEIETSGDSAFSDGGDSGSLIYTLDGLAVGLLFAGSEQGGSNGLGLTYANPIGEVLSNLHCVLET